MFKRAFVFMTWLLKTELIWKCQINNIPTIKQQNKNIFSDFAALFIRQRSGFRFKHQKVFKKLKIFLVGMLQCYESQPSFKIN